MDKKDRRSTAPSMRAAREAEQYLQAEQNKVTKRKKKARQIFYWLVGIIFALVPLLVCEGEILLYSDNPDVIAHIISYRESFIGSGSVLWIGITVLVMSLIDVMLYGTKKDFYKNDYFRVFMAAVVFFLIIACALFFNNITTPVNYNILVVTSWICFMIFAVLSGIITFYMVQEN